MKVGFVDYYLSEWHANHYPEWFADEAKKAGMDVQIAYAWAERDCSPVDGRTTAEWCAEFGVQACESLAELCEKSDAILILAPSNPEKHLEYAKAVFPYRKPTYMDKPLALEYAVAKEILDLAKQYGTPMYSSSSLRFATELDLCGDCTCVLVTGGGHNMEEELVHPLEIMVKKMGVGAVSVRAERIGEQTHFLFDYADGRRSCSTFGLRYPFTVYMTQADGTSKYRAIEPNFFTALVADMLRFFADGNPSFDPAQTLEVIKLLQASLVAYKEPGKNVLIAEVC